MPFPLDEMELKKTEEEIGAVLPESYRNAMKKCNGGIFREGSVFEPSFFRLGLCMVIDDVKT